MKITGLTENQVLASRAKYGTNTVPEPRAKTALDFLIDVFKSRINLMLLIMTILFIGIAVFGYGDMSEAIGIGTVLIIVAVVEVFTRMNSQRSMIELRRRAMRTTCNVLRNGVTHNISIADIVVGDTVILQTGDTIPADGYIIRGHMTVNNSVLNGESDEVKKHVVRDFKYNPRIKINADHYVDQNHLFAGTSVHGGGGLMCVTRIGLYTENAGILRTLGDIADEKTGLQIQLDALAGRIGKIGGICAVMVAIILTFINWQSGEFSQTGGAIYTLVGIFVLALTIFVAAVPEGLPFIIGIITSQNVRQMARANLLIKNPNKIPEAGNIQLLCTDKTGTITYGKMQPVANYTGDGSDIGFIASEHGAILELIKNIVLNGRAMLDESGNVVGGNGTERALFGALKLNMRTILTIKRNNRVIKRVPFTSTNKFSATTVNTPGGIRTYIMAAPELILSHARFYIDKSGVRHRLSRKKLEEIILDNARRAMRVIATAYYDGKIINEKIPDNLVFISLAAMRDEVRNGVSEVIQKMRKSGVQIMMITGDILDTARAIAVDCGIMKTTSDIAIKASEFDKLSDSDAREMLPNIRVIARATPYTKLRVVELARNLGRSIGMCGDGTNDAPALRAADVGFAMGDSTDVCKEASDIIITDNNFISVVNCVLIGRTFMHNIRGFLKFQLPINFILVAISILFPLLIGIGGIAAVQILLVNIVIDSINSFAFGGEKARPEYMTEPAMGKGNPLIGRETLGQILWTTVGGTFILSLTVAPFFEQIFINPEAGISGRFAILVIMAMLNGLWIRATPGYNIFSRFRNNPMFFIIALMVFAGTYLCVTYGGPVLGLESLDWIQWLWVILLGIAILPINMLHRLIFE
jgi:calcium-translocating P-type ATPase